MDIEKKKFQAAIKNFKWSYDFDTGGIFDIRSYGQHAGYFEAEDSSFRLFSFFNKNKQRERESVFNFWAEGFQIAFIYCVEDIHGLKIKKLWR